MELQIKILLYCLAIAGLGLFFQECMKPNMIFRRYYLWLLHHWIKNWRKKDRWRRWLLKPLGICVYCNTAYITIFFYLYKFGPDLEIFLALGISYLWLKLLEKTIIWKKTLQLLKLFTIFVVETSIKQKITLFKLKDTSHEVD